VKSSCGAPCGREPGLPLLEGLQEVIVPGLPLLEGLQEVIVIDGQAENQSDLGAPKRYGPTNCPGLISPPERGFARTPPWPRGSPGTPD
jgi:hypothetical protein